MRKIVNKLLRLFPPDAVRAGFVRLWMAQNPEAVPYLRDSGATARILDLPPHHDVSRIQSQLEHRRSALSLKDLELVFELCIDPSRKRKEGAVYTPDYIIDYLVSEGLRSKAKPRSLRVLDPACGSGGFLLRAASYLEQRFGIPPSVAFREIVFGIDKNPSAIEHAKCLIELYMAQRGESFPVRDARLVCQDTLLVEPHTLLESIGSPSGVQLVTTNPPYVKLQSLPAEYRSALTAKYPQYTRFNFSLANLFLIAAQRLLADDGCLAIITQNNLFTSLAGEAVRRFLQQSRKVWRIVDFGHYRVFRGVLAYTCLIFADAKSHDSIEYDRIERQATLDDLRNCSFDRIPYASLNPTKWRLAKLNHLANLRRIESTGTPLGRIVNIRVGFATLKDKVFLVDDAQGDTCIARHPKTGKAYLIEKALTMPAVRVADISDDVNISDVARRVIFPYRRVGGRFELVSEADIARCFPRAYRYLRDCRELLQSRDNGKRTYEAWYAWGRTQGRSAPGPKLLTKTFSARPRFFLDKTDMLFCNGYGLFPRTADLFCCEVTLNTLKLLLESWVMHYYVKLTSFQIDGDFQCYQKNFIERFGIPELSEDDEHAIRTLNDEQREAYIAELYGISIDDLCEVLGPCGTRMQLNHTP